MRLNTPTRILSLPGQCVKHVQHDLDLHRITITCSRSPQLRIIEPSTGQAGRANGYRRRIIRDLPMCGFDCHLDIELIQVITADGRRLLERSKFVDKSCRYTLRFCHLVSGMCRHMSISAVAKHLKMRWETVKNIDKNHLIKTLPALDHSTLKDLKYIGVDEVARAKGHDYMTLIYNMVTGHLIGVETGRKSEVLINFLKGIPEEITEKIEAVAMDMGPAYQAAVRQCLPNADIVFDRFHVMQNYNKTISNQRRIEFRKANKEDKELLKGTHYLLLKNSHKLDEKQSEKLQTLLKKNTNMHTLYVLKEQLQAIWMAANFTEMQFLLEQWCLMAEQSGLIYLIKFAKSLRRHAVGICNYAKHKLTSARIEAGNVSIGMIRKRARGIQDTDYFKLKIRQSSLPDDCSMFYCMP